MTIPHRRLGQSGLKPPLFSLGSWVVSHPISEDLKACLNAALDHGVNFIDSAEAYANGAAEFEGNSFRTIAEAAGTVIRVFGAEMAQMTPAQSKMCL